jgi:glycine hydroxymethyltransferase
MPSENVTSPEVRKLLASDLGHRYTLPLNDLVSGSFVENAYRGTKYIDAIEGEAEATARRVFNCRHASLKPLSGHIAGLICLISTCRRGDLFMAVGSEHGGYDGYGPGYLPDLLGLEMVPIPFNPGSWNLDPDGAARAIEEMRPRLVLLGQSFFLFPYPMDPIRKACGEAGSLLAYDGSHVLGLIAGGKFQAPLKEGADILFGSTHKSFYGPQGGIILADRDDPWEGVGRSLVWRSLDNAHWNRIAALGLALEEMETHGSRYAAQVVANSKALAAALADGGFPLLFGDLGWTLSHQLMIDTKGLKDRYGLTPHQLAVGLEGQDIIVDAVGRLGANEVTRMGAMEAEMEVIAELILDHLAGRTVRPRVAKLRRGLEMEYRLDR